MGSNQKKLVRSKDVVFQLNQTLKDFNKAKKSKITSDAFIKFVTCSYLIIKA